MLKSNCQVLWYVTQMGQALQTPRIYAYQRAKGILNFG